MPQVMLAHGLLSLVIGVLFAWTAGIGAWPGMLAFWLVGVGVLFQARTRPLLPNEQGAFIFFTIACLGIGCILAFPILELTMWAYAANAGVTRLPPTDRPSLFTGPSMGNLLQLLFFGALGSLLCVRLPASTRTMFLFIALACLLLFVSTPGAGLALLLAVLVAPRLRSAFTAASLPTSTQS